MAEAVISDIAVGLISKLGSSVLTEIGLQWGLKDELQDLKETVSTIEAVLLDAEEKSMVDHQVKHWLGMLSEAMYDADDLLDDIFNRHPFSIKYMLFDSFFIICVDEPACTNDTNC